MSVQEVNVKDLISHDRIFLKTARSTYVFVVTDPTTRTGILSGGVLNDRRLEVQFLCSVRKGAETGDDNSIMRVGAQAVFIYSEASRTRYLITSTLTALTPPCENSIRKNIFFCLIVFFGFLRIS